MADGIGAAANALAGLGNMGGTVGGAIGAATVNMADGSGVNGLDAGRGVDGNVNGGAAGVGAAGQGNQQNQGNQANGAERGGTSAGPLSFEEMLKDRAFSAEYDRRVSKSLETARGKWEQDAQARIEAARVEAEKVARMTAQERAAHEMQSRADELARRETEILRRELRAQAAEQLAAKELPVRLAELLDYSSAERMSQTLETLEAEFRPAAQAYAKEKLSHGAATPRTGEGVPDPARARMREAIGLKP